MKLNYRRTLLAGLAFMAIYSFWQTYDNIVPLILKNSFELNEIVTGVVMAADNVLALFLLPMFGTLSDKVNTKWGNRNTSFGYCNCIYAYRRQCEKPSYVFDCDGARASFYGVLPLTGSGSDAGCNAKTFAKQGKCHYKFDRNRGCNLRTCDDGTCGRRR